jgi:hypothetical protein
MNESEENFENEVKRFTFIVLSKNLLNFLVCKDQITLKFFVYSKKKSENPLQNQNM